MAAPQAAVLAAALILYGFLYQSLRMSTHVIHTMEVSRLVLGLRMAALNEGISDAGTVMYDALACLMIKLMPGMVTSGFALPPIHVMVQSCLLASVLLLVFSRGAAQRFFVDVSEIGPIAWAYQSMLALHRTVSVFSVFELLKQGLLPSFFELPVMVLAFELPWLCVQLYAMMIQMAKSGGAYVFPNALAIRRLSISLPASLILYVLKSSALGNAYAAYALIGLATVSATPWFSTKFVTKRQLAS